LLGAVLRGPLAEEWRGASEAERRALLTWKVADMRWNKATRSFW